MSVYCASVAMVNFGACAPPVKPPRVGLPPQLCIRVISLIL